MNIIPFPSLAKHPTPEDAVLAAQLRILANEVEGGEVAQLIVTVIRPDGQVERLGIVSDVTKAL